MALKLTKTNYDGEVLERLLTKATTGNDLVQKGLIYLQPNVHHKFTIPRLKTSKMLQKRKEMPTSADSKGDFVYDERELIPQDFMAYTEFNPATFEHVWREFQPEGQLVFQELPANVQNELLDAMSRQVDFELGFHFIQGIFGTDDDHLFNGIVPRMLADVEVITVHSSETTMIKKFKAVRDQIPATMRVNPRLRFLVSQNDADNYDDELTNQQNKGANHTELNAMKYKNIPIEPLANWPDGLIVATIASIDPKNTNLWGAVNLVDDANVIKIAPVTNAGELYFFKMLMKADTNVAWGEHVIILDTRDAATAEVSGTKVKMAEYCSKVIYTPTADVVWTIEGDGIMLGASLKVTNKATDHKIVVESVTVPAGKTRTIRYGDVPVGKEVVRKWFATDKETEE